MSALHDISMDTSASSPATTAAMTSSRTTSAKMPSLPSYYYLSVFGPTRSRRRRRTTMPSTKATTAPTMTSMRQPRSMMYYVACTLLCLALSSFGTSSTRFACAANYNNNNNNNNNKNNNNNDDNNGYYNATDDQVALTDDADEGGQDLTVYADGMDDAFFQFEGDMDFDDVSIMPVSCVNYHGGNMIKFQFYEKSTSYNCHFRQLGTFVVSIAHYMRAYFNHQALTHGVDFQLPGDVGFLNCVLLKETAKSEIKLYAKIGCQNRNTYTSTKLQLIVYKDAQCSKPYENLDEDKRNNGYDINGYFLSKKVSFRPPFYSCQSCLPETIADDFSKRYTAWYDDDYISIKGRKQSFNDDANGEYAAQGGNNGGGGNDDAANASNSTDDGSYYKANDDTYNGGGGDDAYANNDGDDAGANYNHYVNTDDGVYYNYKAHDDDFYAIDDDARRGLRRNLGELDASHSLTAKDALKDYTDEFSQEMSLIHRQLDQNNQQGMNNIGTWNMCERVHHYGMWCDEDCRSLDTFRVDEWSRSDVFLLVIMCVFMGAMMLLVFAKRVKAYERAAMWGDEPGAPNPGLPPTAMLMLFAIVFTIIIVLAVLKFVNETLVFAVVTCILLFIYMLKLTLFESRKPQFLPARSTRNHSLKEPFYT